MRPAAPVAARIAAILLLAVGGGVISCGPTGRDAALREIGPDDPLRIAVTIHPLALIARELIDPADAGIFRVTTLVPAEATPHGFEPPPAQVAALEKADLALMVGFGLDDWAARARGDRPTVRFSGIEAEAMTVGSPSGVPPHAHPLPHASVDPHVWLDPALVAPFARATAAAVGTRLATAGADPAVVARLETRLARFLEQVDAVDRATRARLAPFEGQAVITFHDSLHRYAERYGLVIASILKPLEGVEPAPADLKRALDEIGEHGIRTIFIEPEYPPTAAERVAEQSGVRLLSIDPLGIGAESWQQMMEVLARTIAEGLGGER